MLAAPASSLGAEPPVSFGPPITTEMPESENSLIGAIATADFNADGHEDAVAYAGSFLKPTQSLQVAISGVTAGDSEGWNWQKLTPPSVDGFEGPLVAAANMNPDQDSRPDIVALGVSSAEGDSVLAVYLNAGDGTFTGPIETDLPKYANGLAVGDVNGDGIPDVLIPTVVETPSGGGEAEVVTLLGKGNGEFETPIVSPIDAEPSVTDVLASAIVIGDFTGSGHADIAVSQSYSPAHDVYVMSGDGQGEFTVRTALDLGAGSYDLASGDFDGEGHADLALPIGDLAPGGGGGVGDERIATALGDGAGSFTPLTPAEPKWEVEEPVSYGIRTADLNGDGRPDLLVPIASGSRAGGVWALLGNGDGSFSTADREGLESEDVWAAEAGDFNGDGHPDIAALVWPGGKLKLTIYDNTSEPSLHLGTSSVDLGAAEMGQATTAPLAITNSGNYGLSVSSLSVGGADAADFSVSGCTGAPIAPGATCEATVRFAPSVAGSRSATLTIASDDPTQPSTTVALSGTGSPAPGGGGSGPSGGGDSGTSGGGPGTSGGGGSSSSTNGTPIGTKAKETKGEAAPGAAGKLALAKKEKVSNGGLTGLKLKCVGGPCRGKLVLTVAVKKKVKGKPKTVTLRVGSAAYSLAAGKSEAVAMKFPTSARVPLASAPSHKLAATATIEPTGGSKYQLKVTLVGAKGPKKVI